MFAHNDKPDFDHKSLGFLPETIVLLKSSSTKTCPASCPPSYLYDLLIHISSFYLTVPLFFPLKQKTVPLTCHSRHSHADNARRYTKIWRAKSHPRKLCMLLACPQCCMQRTHNCRCCSAGNNPKFDGTKQGIVI